MSTCEIFDTLVGAGFEVDVNYPYIGVRLLNRKPSCQEVWAALDYQIDRSRLFSSGLEVKIKS